MSYIFFHCIVFTCHNYVDIEKSDLTMLGRTYNSAMAISRPCVDMYSCGEEGGLK